MERISQRRAGWTLRTDDALTPSPLLLICPHWSKLMDYCIHSRLPCRCSPLFLQRLHRKEETACNSCNKPACSRAESNGKARLIGTNICRRLSPWDRHQILKSNHVHLDYSRQCGRYRPWNEPLIRYICEAGRDSTCSCSTAATNRCLWIPNGNR